MKGFSSNWYLLSQWRTFSFFCNRKVHCQIHKMLSLNPSWASWIQSIFSHYFSKIYFSNNLPSTVRSPVRLLSKRFRSRLLSSVCFSVKADNLLTLRLSPKTENHSLSAVYECIFDLFVAVHIRRPSPWSATRGTPETMGSFSVESASLIVKGIEHSTLLQHQKYNYTLKWRSMLGCGPFILRCWDRISHPQWPQSVLDFCMGFMAVKVVLR
jgi:hypothetical protein